jgi:tight adherence protein C
MSLAIIAAIAACLAGSAAALELIAAPTRRPAWRRRRPPTAAAPAARWARQSSGDHATEALLDAAGRGAGVGSAAELQVRQQSAGMLAAAWSGAVLSLLAGPIVAAAVVPVAGVLGRRLPILLLRRVARDRAVRLREAAPETIALAAAAAGCGLPLPAMLGTVAAWLTDELADGFRRATADLHRGAAPDRVLDRLEREHPIPEVTTLVAILRRGRTHGMATAPALQAHADAARAARARRAGERAARAAPRIQLVAALLLVPAALCILAAAMLAGRAG